MEVRAAVIEISEEQHMRLNVIARNTIEVVSAACWAPMTGEEIDRVGKVMCEVLRKWGVPCQRVDVGFEGIALTLKLCIAEPKGHG